MLFQVGIDIGVMGGEVGPAGWLGHRSRAGKRMDDAARGSRV